MKKENTMTTQEIISNAKTIADKMAAHNATDFGSIRAGIKAAESIQVEIREFLPETDNLQDEDYKTVRDLLKSQMGGNFIVNL